MRLGLSAAALLGVVCTAAPAAWAADKPLIPPAPPPTAAPATAPATADPVIARVNGVAIHRSDVEAAQQNLPAEAQKLPFAKVFPVLVDRLVDAELILQAGRKANLQDDSEVKARLKAIEDRLIEEAYVKREVNTGVTEARLKARYDAWVKTQKPREEVRARHILVPTEAVAKDIIAQLDKGADFAALAQKYSKDRGGASGGDLGYFTRDEMVPEFSAAAFALKPGQYTKTPVKTEFGWHVIEAEDRRTAPPPSFAASRNDIAKLVANEIVEADIKKLQAGAKIETFGPDGKPLPSGGLVPQPLTPGAATPDK